MLRSLDGLVGVYVARETAWFGHTVFPDLFVIRVTYRDLPVVGFALSNSSFDGDQNVLCCGVVRLETVSTSAPASATRCWRVSLQGRHECLGVVHISVRTDGVTWKFETTNPGKTGLVFLPSECPSVTFPTDGQEKHDLFFTAHGMLTSLLHDADGGSLRLWRRPGDLVVEHFSYYDPPREWAPADAKSALTALFTRIPFWRKSPGRIVFPENVTDSFRSALMWILRRETCDDEWVMRGEIGDFLVLARRVGKQWTVAGLTGAQKMLTIRTEDLWRRCSGHLGLGRCRVSLFRDPTGEENGAKVEESFADCECGVKIVLDLRSRGGFLCVVEQTT